jgi:type IV fimbrial biogenesis protein FimT
MYQHESIAFSKTTQNSPFVARSRGFTMVELMVAIAVSAILLTIAAPDFGQFIRDVRIRTATEDFITAINVARTEALKRGDTVMMCRTGNPNAGLTTLACAANEPNGDANQDRDWTPGWIVYAKPGYTGTGGGADYNRATDGDPIMIGNPSPTGVAILSDGDGNRWLTFFGDGSLNETGAPVYAICDDRGTAKGRMITVPLVGRPHASDTVATCSPT